VVVSPGDADALADAVRQLLTESGEARTARAARARGRIIDEYGIEDVAAQYRRFYEEMLRPPLG
jgi:glycosyltransferase involved in cell wall biosynthesis